MSTKLKNPNPLPSLSPRSSEEKQITEKHKLERRLGSMARGARVKRGFVATERRMTAYLIM